VLFGAQIDEQVVGFGNDFFNTRVGPVDLVDDENDRQAARQRFFQDEAGLRQRAFARVHEQDGAVHHVEAALHFSAEIRVAGRVDDVDLDAVVRDGRVFGRNRDAALLFERQGIHDAVLHRLIGAENAGLFEHGVEQRGFAVVNVRDDRNIS